MLGRGRWPKKGLVLTDLVPGTAGPCAFETPLISVRLQVPRDGVLQVSALRPEPVPVRQRQASRAEPPVSRARPSHTGQLLRA